MRRPQIPETRTYLYWSIGLFLAGLLFIWDGFLVACLAERWDGWLPRRDVLSRHPPGEDSFYLFNQITGVGMWIAAAVCAYIHRVVR